MGGVCAQLLTDIDPKIASQWVRTGEKMLRPNMWKSGMKSRPWLTPIFFLRNSDITKKKRQNKTVKTNKNNDLRLLIIWFRSRLKKCNGVLTLLLLNQKRTEGI